MNRVVVIGSINADLLIRVPWLPVPGETLLALDATEALGGKGQAQAVAAARFGATSQLIACVGDDESGRAALLGLHGYGVDSSLVRRSSGSTGRAVVAVDPAGENSIIVIPGANSELQSLTNSDKAAIEAADVVLLQLENGLPIVEAAITHARAHHVTVMLNAAPAAAVPPELLAQLDHLIVNEGECVQLGGGPDVHASASALAQLSANVLVTLGAAGGVLYRAQAAPLALPALEIVPVDTTGAGDTFCGVFSAAIAERLPVEQAFRLALVAGSLAALKPGNAPAVPSRDEVLAATPPARP